MSLPSIQLEGKVALVTGGNRGLGRVMALGFIAEADEIVGTALYLASDASASMTGALLALDGGGA